MLIHELDNAENIVHNDEKHDDVGDQQFGDDFDVSNDDVEKEHEMSQDEDLSDAHGPPHVQIWRFNR